MCEVPFPRSKSSISLTLCLCIFIITVVCFFGGQIFLKENQLFHMLMFEQTTFCGNNVSHSTEHTFRCHTGPNKLGMVLPGCVLLLAAHSCSLVRGFNSAYSWSCFLFACWSRFTSTMLDTIYK